MSVISPAINGQFYSWSSIRFNFLGSSFSTVTAIKYEETDEIKGVKGVGTKQIGYTQDNTETTGSISVLVETLEKIVKKVPNGRLQDIAPFPITVSYRDALGNLNSHVLKGCKFTKNSREASAGSTDALSVEIPLYIHDINWKA
ncbi:hypothetical protein QWY81_17895 [Polaribacter undariae]|uniref:Uncharacterized protein n=1 Tax=Polaribacter sejongensis TaxID=985043 RepID=A0AAJ1R040_9FLAO|nr:hypothetical protein [Polaribacter undariae]MDN3621345.1 hypothetical protein [Polaribacter undariae]UWD31887.1 hypothetical protein NQP51_17360 [Polaribacter undariae]